MQFRCDKGKRVVLFLGKGLICRQKLQIHLGMRDNSLRGCTTTKKHLPLYYHEAEWSTLSSWCLDPIKFFNLKPYPEPLSTMPSWTSLSCWEHVEKGLCTVWHRLSSPPCLRISSWVAMVTSSTLQKPFFVTDEVIIANLLLANIFSKDEMCARYEPHGGSVQENCRKDRSITVKNLVRRVTGLN